MTHLSAVRRRLRRGPVLASAAALAIACTEPSKTVQSDPSPVPSLHAQVELSDSLARPGTEVRVTVRLVGTPVASVTARLAYDTAGLEFLREEALDDGATRVTNPAPGLVRFAAIAPQGFAEGRLSTLHFMVRRTDAARSLRIHFDEVHTVTRVDARNAVTSRSP